MPSSERPESSQSYEYRESSVLDYISCSRTIYLCTSVVRYCRASSLAFPQILLPHPTSLIRRRSTDFTSSTAPPQTTSSPFVYHKQRHLQSYIQRYLHSYIHKQRYIHPLLLAIFPLHLKEVRDHGFSVQLLVVVAKKLQVLLVLLHSPNVHLARSHHQEDPR